jgi:hypothetical protein
MSAPSENPFAPSQSELPDVPDLTPGSPIKAVLVGLTIALGGGFLSGVVLGAICMAIGMSPQEFVAAGSNTTSSLSIIAETIGLIFSALSGFACARIAKRSEYRLAAIVDLQA